MKLDSSAMLLYAVTDRSWVGVKTLYEQVELALKGGVTCVQLREKNISQKEFLSEAVEICNLCKKYKVPFIINDNVEVAIKSGADGVHVGQADMDALDVRKRIGKDMILGVSAHTPQEAVLAVKNGADYLGAGAVFSTSTKLDVSVMKHETLQEICNAVAVPVVAIGGINKENIEKLSGSGVDGVALVSAIFSVDNIQEECRELLEISKKMVDGVNR